MLPRRRTPAALAACATGSKRAMDSAMEQLMLAWAKASEAALNTTTSPTPAASAASKPFMFGTSAEYTVPGWRLMRAMTSAPSAICGTHLGETKAAASTLGRPAAESRSISSTFTSGGTGLASFCSPSRGPTSTSLTCCGKCIVGIAVSLLPCWDGRALNSPAAYRPGRRAGRRARSRRSCA
ncbi:hypothetical protein GALL_342880 [mine drainage metagenome]|uniref:Uncharacterized protein n=1 Tax=mine drainage metagenome TaxID=410659 RepID=A0A1J5QKR8_9ZZZZ